MAKQSEGLVCEDCGQVILGSSSSGTTICGCTKGAKGRLSGTAISRIVAVVVAIVLVGLVIVFR